MMRELRNVALISFGVALVATSKSFGVRADEQVAHAAADQVRLVAGAGQLADHAIGVGIDRGAVQRRHRNGGAVPRSRKHTATMQTY